MQVQVNTDNHIEGSAGLTAHVEAVVIESLQRFGDRITRVEVHLNDVNSHKGGEDDKRCTMEARLAGFQPQAVTADGATINDAIDNAIEKLEKSLDRTLDKKYDPKGRTSFSGE